jgi:hypothetical protein
MSRPRAPHLLRLTRVRFWTVAIALTVGSIGCDDHRAFLQPTPSLQIIAGNDQTGRVGEPVADPLVVRVDDESGVPVSGIVVVWTVQGGGSVDPDSVPTDSDGLAVVSRVLGPNAGEQTTTAAVSGLPGVDPVTFTTTAVAEE